MEKVCCVCEGTTCSYKCPTCKVPYCSAACYKVHKASNCQPRHQQNKPTSGQKAKGKKYDFPTEDTVPIEKLEQLRYSEGIKDVLRNPHVRDIMRAILVDENPTKAIALAMTEPIFVEMADACLKVVELPENDQPS
ncbi:zinc finger HIT domain-containing protein 3 [Lasioglossum baleicum]|uniref:zinc finger HIT domain-containing protein 3 n=1 Tax=Lasioglossum baleicum TaxID=434251 RepID=UPI003FCDE112